MYISRPPETFFQKSYFECLELGKNVFWCIFAYYHTNRKMFKKDIFDRLEWFKTCLTTRNFFFKKDNFDRLEQLKTFFDAFAHTPRPPETFCQKRYFWPSGVVKNVFWCICAYFQTTETFGQKRYFLPSGVVKSVFCCISTYFQNTRNFFSKEIFVTVWSGYKRVFMHLRILPYH